MKDSNFKHLVNGYYHAWMTLRAYDDKTLGSVGIPSAPYVTDIDITLKEFTDAIDAFKEEWEDKNFGAQQSASNIESIWHNVFQVIDGKDVYPSVEEKAANLFYLIVKNHLFVDGNKRIGAFAFLWFLKEVFLRKDSNIDRSLGHYVKFNSTKIVLLTLLIAMSTSSDKESIINIIMMNIAD